MIEPARCTRFLFEPTQAVGIRRESLWQNLNRHLPPNSIVFGPVDLSHASHTEQGVNLVGTDLLPYQQLGWVLGHPLSRYLQGGRFNKALSWWPMASSDSTFCGELHLQHRLPAGRPLTRLMLQCRVIKHLDMLPVELHKSLEGLCSSAGHLRPDLSVRGAKQPRSRARVDPRACTTVVPISPD